jgi:hypothetical protein
MDLISYGGILTTSNKAGTDLSIDAFSDINGNTTAVTVSADDIVLEAIVDPVTLVTTGTLWLVNEGDPWIDITPNGQTPGVAMIATAPDVPYQTGTLIVWLTANRFVVANQSLTQLIVDSAIGGP